MIRATARLKLDEMLDNIVFCMHSSCFFDAVGVKYFQYLAALLFVGSMYLII